MLNSKLGYKAIELNFFSVCTCITTYFSYQQSFLSIFPDNSAVIKKNPSAWFVEEVMKRWEIGFQMVNKGRMFCELVLQISI